MGFFSKAKPLATRKRLALPAFIGAICMSLFVFLLLQPRPLGMGVSLPSTTLALWVVGASVIGAGIGALVEWESDDSRDDKPVDAVENAGVWDRDVP